MGLTKLKAVMLILISFSFAGCVTYSFTGASIPSDVNTIYIPFFPDQSNSGLGDLGDQLNQVLIDRFVNQSSLQLANNEADADAVLDGSITSYSNRPFSIGGDEQTGQNQVSISVRASFKYASKEEPEWNKSFNGRATYDPAQNPIDGERAAAIEALEQVANNMFNDAVSNW
ncbi:LPS assembly lipoprotein LptE [Gracilimonas sp. Q87]|uniref:LPS assembly lipoprotein LptE n=1 Tax=Gracilimonas sp. Q87 TaxID=3384766 RepID=UPI00398400E5